MNKKNKNDVTHATGGHLMRTNGSCENPEILYPKSEKMPEPQKGFAKASPSFKPLTKPEKISEEDTKKAIANNTKIIKDETESTIKDNTSQSSE